MSTHCLSVLLFSNVAAVSRQVYRGPDRTYRLSNLTAKSDYQVRVNAVRQTKDDSGANVTLTGPYSIATPFSTPSVARSPNAGGANTMAGGLKSLVRGWVSEQTWMYMTFVLILVAFMFFAIVVAFVAKQIVD